MSSVSLNDGNVTRGSEMCQLMVKDDLDRLQLLFYVSMGCAAWAVWKISGAIRKFSDRLERSMNFVPHIINVDQKITNNAASIGTVTNFQKDWHDGISNELRELLLKKQTHSELPTNNATDGNSAYRPVVIDDHVLKLLESLIRKVEGDDVCNVAESRITNNAAPMETASNSQKDWHKEMNSQMRENFVTTIINAVCPSYTATDENSVHRPVIIEDHMLRKLESYARKIEDQSFNLANSKAEYYHMMAEKCCKIKKELERKQKRREQQELQKNQMQQQQPPQMSQFAPESQTLQQNQLTSQPSPQTWSSSIGSTIHKWNSHFLP